jgi:hypothetical protein
VCTIKADALAIRARRYFDPRHKHDCCDLKQAVFDMRHFGRRGCGNREQYDINNKEALLLFREPMTEKSSMCWRMVSFRNYIV